MSLVVDLALQIAHSKLSAHATRRRDRGTHQGFLFRDFPLHDSGRTMVQLVLMQLRTLFLPIAVALCCVLCIILHSPCCVTLDRTVLAHDLTCARTRRLRGAAIRPVPVLVAVHLVGVASSAVHRLCTWAGDVPESLKTTAGLLHTRSTCPCFILLPSLS